jgi:hypothetical protein
MFTILLSLWLYIIEYSIFLLFCFPNRRSDLFESGVLAFLLLSVCTHMSRVAYVRMLSSNNVDFQLSRQTISAGALSGFPRTSYLFMVPFFLASPLPVKEKNFGSSQASSEFSVTLVGLKQPVKSSRLRVIVFHAKQGGR